MPNETLVTLADIEQAARRIRPLVRRTPLYECERLTEDLGARVLVKAENLQHTGSFKVRGVLNTLLTWREHDALPLGVVTFSAGNHAAAVAYATRRVGLPSVVCMPPGAVRTKVEAARRYGAEVVFTDDLLGTCRKLGAERGYALLHPFDATTVIAGQGTAGLEIVDACPDPDLVVVPVGGGGLISGVATAVKERRPEAWIVGAEPETANAMSYALRHGVPDPLPRPPRSLADGLGAPFAGRHTLAHTQEYVDEVVEVPEERLLGAWWRLLEATKLLVEPSAAIGLAAIEAGLVTVPEGGIVVLVLSGGNTSPEALQRLATG